MTNVELIKILQGSVKKFGVLSVNMNIIECDSEQPYDVEDALYDNNSVSLYNY